MKHVRQACPHFILTLPHPQEDVRDQAGAPLAMVQTLKQALLESAIDSAEQVCAIQVWKPPARGCGTAGICTRCPFAQV
eukprot:350953-Chlamydomonas_euryale.AAC.3